MSPQSSPKMTKGGEGGLDQELRMEVGEVDLLLECVCVCVCV